MRYVHISANSWSDMIALNATVEPRLMRDMIHENTQQKAMQT